MLFRSVAHRRDDVAVPALVVAGWHDVFLRGSLASAARSRNPRDRLVVGPWAHDDRLSHLVGSANLGLAGNGDPRLFDWALDFYDAARAGADPPLPPVRAYALGARRWVDLPSWPPPEAARVAHALRGGTFAAAPDDPVPSLGGRNLLLGAGGLGFGVVDQRPVAARDDVLVERIALDEATLLAGPIVARLRADADGGDALWALTLCVEQPDGALHNLADGVAAGAGELAVELGDAFALLPAGAALVLLVAGSSHPRWPRPSRARRQAVGPGSCLELTVAPAGLAGV